MARSGVYSRALNENLESSAVEGAYASVIGGAPAAAVVFSREVDARTGADPRIASLDERMAAAADAERQQLRAERDALWTEVRAQKLGEFAAEFDAIHSIERAVEVGSVERIIPAPELRPYLISAVERGMRARTIEQMARGNGFKRSLPLSTEQGVPLLSNIALTQPIPEDSQLGRVGDAPLEKPIDFEVPRYDVAVPRAARAVIEDIVTEVVDPPRSASP